MSTTYLRLIPTEPTFVPDERARVRALDLLRSVTPLGTEVTIKLTDEVIFVDQGMLFETVSCPSCGTRYAESGQPHGWWHQAMDSAFANNFRDLLVTIPCCGAPVSLNDLRYKMPAGFARFILNLGPQWKWEVETNYATLENILGCKLRLIWARY